MSDDRFRVVTFLCFSVLLAPTDGLCQVADNPRLQAPIWDHQSTPGLTLIAEKNSLVNKPTFSPDDELRGAPTYTLRVKSASTGALFNLWLKPLNRKPALLGFGSGSCVTDSDGRVLLRHEDGTAPLPVAMAKDFARGEPVELCLVSVDGQSRAFTRVIPYPLEASNEVGYRVSMELATRRSYIIVSTGFEPDTEVKFYATDVRFVDATNTKYDARDGMGMFTTETKGDKSEIMLVSSWEAPPEKLGGVSKVSVEGKRGKLELDVEWGNAIQAPRNRAISLHREAVKLFDAKSYERAFEVINASIDADSTYPSAYLYRATIYADVQSDLENALKDLNKAIELDSTYPTPFYLRALIWKELGKIDNAIADYGECIRLRPDNPNAYVNLAILWTQKGDYENAVNDYSKAIELKLDDAEIYTARGEAWRKLESFERAIDDYREAIKVDPEYVRAYLLRAYVLKNQGELQRALSDYDKVAELHPKYADNLVLRGRLLTSLGNYERAIADLSAATKLPGSHQVTARNELAWLLATCPDPNHRDGIRAVHEARNVCDETDWNKAQFLDTMAAAYAESGDFEKAIQFQLDAINLGSASDRPDYQNRLELYRSGQPYRADEVGRAASG